ncbi:hypothetical protein Ruko_11920 [Ruthenibacterium sp. TH_2024_36131]
MQKRLAVLAEICQQFDHILEIALGFDGFVYISAAAFELVSAGGVLDDLPLFHAFDQPVIDA